MLDISTEFDAHISSGSTTLCTCWKLTRSDGQALGFTDHDCILSFDGQSYDPMTGWQGSAVEASLGASIDSHDVIGILRSDQLSENDIARGRYDGALVETYRVNWRDTSVRLHQRSDSFGEITRQDDIFRAELRSAETRLNHTDGRRFQFGCDARLGDARCGVDIETSLHRGVLSVSEILDGYRIRVTGLGAFAPSWFSAGFLVWSSGAHDKIRSDIVRHSRDDDDDLLTFAHDLSGFISVNDTATIYAGCGRDFNTCKNKFANQTNYRGFPHMPGNDFALGYPAPGAALYDGGSLNS